MPLRVYVAAEPAVGVVLHLHGGGHVTATARQRLRDEGEAHAGHLATRACPFQHRRWHRHLHGFLGDRQSLTDADPNAPTSRSPSAGRWPL